jgi:hypothetical protein
MVMTDGLGCGKWHHLHHAIAVDGGALKTAANLKRDDVSNIFMIQC